MLLSLAAVSAVAWVVLLALPWQPWRNRHLISARPDLDPTLDDVCVLIPARNEVALLPATLRAACQGSAMQAVVVDDGSIDGTADAARAVAMEMASAVPASGIDLRVIHAAPLPPAWSGKVWAQSQGLHHCHRPLVLLLDADIVVAPGLVAALREKLLGEDLDLVSVMASLRMENAWERLLLPPFIYFFKLIYPFSLSGRPGHPVAAAAGGCILVRRSALGAIGGFQALRDALIDDCTLARLVKRGGGRLWIGQSLDVRSSRAYAGLGGIWNMVTRTAFTQLRYSWLALAATTLAMGLMFVLPLLAVAQGGAAGAVLGLIALTAMTVSFAPCIALYGLHPGWIASLPLAAVLYMAMTWDSAFRFQHGQRASWRGRQYPTSGGLG